MEDFSPVPALIGGLLIGLASAVLWLGNGRIAGISGIFGQLLGIKGLEAADTYVLKQGDRIEIYRPLISDPKDARRKRAERSM